MKTSLPLSVLAAFWLANTPLSAQEAVNPAADEAAQTLPEMAAIEQAWARGDYVFVREGLKSLAEHTGSALAQYRYGRVLFQGHGGPVNRVEAVEWLEKAVAQNHMEAATLLARVYLSRAMGDAGYQPERAAELLAGAAARGHAEAQYYLAMQTREGVGVEKNLKAAFNWFLAAAEQDYLNAKYQLARAYSRGEGVAADNEQSLSWLTAAADGGHVDAQYYLALALDSGRGVAIDRRRALSWMLRAAENGFVQAQRHLGKQYLQGDGVEAQPDEALRWLGQAVRAKDPIAQYLLGIALSGDHGIAEDPEEAQIYFSLASDAGYPPATTALGDYALSGRVTEPDLELAVTLFRKAVEQGDPAAALQLGQLAGEGKLEGLTAPHSAVPWAMIAARAGDGAALEWVRQQADAGVRPAQTAYAIWLIADQGQAEAAIAYLRPAADLGDVEAQYQLGMLLTKGEGIEQDYVNAHSWLNIAATGGHDEAGNMRGVIAELMTQEQVAEAQGVARKFFATAASRVPALANSAAAAPVTK